VILTPENYFSPEAAREYMSVSQYKMFRSCEAAAYAELTGEYERPDKEAFLVGHFLHAWSQGPDYLDEFKCNHPEIISSQGKTKGELKAPFRVAEAMIETLEADKKAMFYLRGRKEVPIVAELFGTKWKGCIDVLNDELGYILDLKTAASLTDFKYDPRIGQRVSFIEQWDYMVQSAVYSELERVAAGRDTYRDFYIVAVTKQAPPAHEIFDLTDYERLETELNKIEANLPRILLVKSGAEPPTRCECCAYCRGTKRVGRPVHYTELKEAY